MSDNRTKAILKAGIIPDETIDEFRKWSVPVPEVPIGGDRREVLEGIREAIESHDTVVIRQMRLDALSEFEKQARRARLYYLVDGKTTFVEVDYMKDDIGNYLIPWRDESIEGLMLDPGTYLKPPGELRVYFDDVGDLYHGIKKVFMICRPGRPPLDQEGQ